MSNAKELAQQVRDAIEANSTLKSTDKWLAELTSLANYLPAILALLESCGSATPEQVRAALALAERMAFMWGPDKPMIVRKDCLGGDAVKMIDNYRAAIAQEGGEDK